VVVAFLGGCGGGFSCKNSIGGINCEPVSKVYEKLLTGEIYNRTPKNIKYERSGYKSTTDMADSYSGPSDTSAKSSVAIETSPIGIVNRLKYDESVPLAKEKKKIAIWIAPWIDADGDLHKPEMIYSEIEEPVKWNIGEVVSPKKSKTATPLSVTTEEKR